MGYYLYLLYQEHPFSPSQYVPIPPRCYSTSEQKQKQKQKQKQIVIHPKPSTLQLSTMQRIATMFQFLHISFQM